MYGCVCNKRPIINSPRHAESTYYRPRYDRDTSQIHSRDVDFLRRVHSIFVRQTPDIRQHTLLERSDKRLIYVRFSYAQYTLKARCIHDTDMVDKLNASEITSVWQRTRFLPRPAYVAAIHKWETPIYNLYVFITMYYNFIQNILRSMILHPNELTKRSIQILTEANISVNPKPYSDVEKLM